MVLCNGMFGLVWMSCELSLARLGGGVECGTVDWEVVAYAAVG